ncbi:MAG: hypothetical protein IPM66_06870 [Acidobacteriota bacterium]|nr:MAG: hypothetical protein IPM66_06870 [Acidobacteriota bacterium]
MQTSRRLSSLMLILAALILISLPVMAADPGVAYPADGVVSDQKAGSVLIYNVYTSSATSPALENTRISITNTNAYSSIAVHLFFIDGSSCSPADSIICLTANQTAAFLTSDFDPGTMGYMVAVAIDEVTGKPTNFNYLIGDLYVKFSTGHEANLGAEALAANQPLEFSDSDVTVTLAFNGTQYDRMPATVAVDNIPSRVDGNDTMVILNRPSGNMAIGADGIGSVAGLLFNDAESAHSFTFRSVQCQYKFSFSNTVPRTVPRFTTVIPTGRSGWAKMFTYTGAPLLGAVINYNPAAAASPTAFNQGHNLHKMTLTSSTMEVPVFPPNC